MMSLFDLPSASVQSGKENNEWFTPSKYIEAARDVMGSIDLDPASCEVANRTVKATRYHTQKDNGLLQPWCAKSVWLNPPYAKDEHGQSNLERWVFYLLEQYEIGNVTQAILLVPMTQATKWFDRLWDYPQCFPPYRIHFYTTGVNDWRPRFSSSFAYLGSNESKFIEVFSQFGRIAKAIDAPKPAIIPLSLWEVNNAS